MRWHFDNFAKHRHDYRLCEIKSAENSSCLFVIHVMLEHNMMYAICVIFWLLISATSNRFTTMSIHDNVYFIP